MRASLAVRSLRAAVFAALCVLLAAGGHVLATGQAPPNWADAAGLLAVFAVGCPLGGRERSLFGIGGAMLAAQAGLHLGFEAARPRMAMTMHGSYMTHPHTHALTPHATAAHVAAAVLATWWLRRGEAALWSLLRRAATLVPGLAAWWRVRRGLSPLRPREDAAGRTPAEPWSLRQALLRHAVSRRGPPAGLAYTP
ncbi:MULTISPECIES: hypothetical protein [unclassified Streptomyces]|uniref:hypothetical protein n=1 Tax=unclassified Streptomyces TaxID=2593676 RepID=UPI00224ED980|nr:MULTISPECIES: hypothetical protein [unclassified Streptomyces]MCX4990836.1 hypothetical protein [Streptomyces sp. NBC_00568]MCX5003933.1 hypothetical protein [Streptomyces sp. NBC_00638]